MPVPNKVAELPPLATGERYVCPRDSREAQEEGGRTGWAPGSGCLDPPPVTHFLAREHSVGSLFGQVPGPQGLPPTALSAYGKVPSGLLDPPLSTASSCSGPLGTSATLSAMPPAVFLQTPLPAVPQGPVPGLPPPGGTNTWRSSKQPEDLKTGLEASPPNVHMISEDWGGLMLPGQFHGGGRICTGPDLGEGAGSRASRGRCQTQLGVG